MKMNEYHYTECGLKNVYIEGLQYTADDERVIEIHHIHALHWLIAKAILESKSIDGDEMRFLRTEMGFTPKRLAEELNISEQKVKSLENGKVKIKEEIDLNLRKLGFSLLIVPKLYMYTASPKNETRRIEVIKNAKETANQYRLKQAA